MKVSEHDIDERRLIEAAQRDRGRFADLYEANFDRVYAFVARRVPSREEAEDITAEVFHQALAGLAGFQWQGTPFVAWLLGIASHLVARRWQRATNQPEILLDESELSTTSDQAEQRAWFAQLLDRPHHFGGGACRRVVIEVDDIHMIDSRRRFQCATPADDFRPASTSVQS